MNGEGGCAAAALPLMKELVQMISAHYLCWRLICKDEICDTMLEEDRRRIMYSLIYHVNRLALQNIAIIWRVGSPHLNSRDLIAIWLWWRA